MFNLAYDKNTFNASALPGETKFIMKIILTKNKYKNLLKLFKVTKIITYKIQKKIFYYKAIIK